MPRLTLLLSAAVLAMAPLLARAEGAITVADAYLRAFGPGPGAAYFTIENTSDTADRLVSVTAKPGTMASIHATETDANGMSKMVPLKDGLPLPAHSTVTLKSGGDHVMVMGLPKLSKGQTVTLTLTFDHAAPVTVQAPLDNARRN